MILCGLALTTDHSQNLGAADHFHKANLKSSDTSLLQAGLFKWLMTIHDLPV